MGNITMSDTVRQPGGRRLTKDRPPPRRLTKDRPPIQNALSKVSLSDIADKGAVVAKLAHRGAHAVQKIGEFADKAGFASDAVKTIGHAGSAFKSLQDSGLVKGISKVANNPLIGHGLRYGKMLFEDPNPEEGKRKPNETLGQRAGRITKRIGRKFGRFAKTAIRDAVAGGLGFLAGGPAGAATGIGLANSLLPT